MTDINIDWLAENFPNNCVIFDIGCANLGDTVAFQMRMPDNIYHGFECSHAWKDNNIMISNHHAINYHHIAMSDNNNGLTFYPSKTFNGEEWHWSGTFKPTHQNNLEWGEPYTVESITLNDFCKNNNIKPDFIHIDVEGHEHSVLCNMDIDIKPKAIWAEICILHSHSMNSVQEFNDMLSSQGYTQVYSNFQDALYVLDNSNLTPYTE